MANKIFLFALAMTILSLSIHSEETKEKTPRSSLQYTVVVTATKIETPAKEIASSVTVISAEDLKKMKKTTVVEVLQEVLGVTIIQNGGSGTGAACSIRGANSEHTLVLMDGVELNDPISPCRSYDLSHLTLENIERIEILRGPQSTLYGSDAIGGVINIITKKGEGKPKITFSSSGGSYATITSDFGASGGAEKINYSLGISYFRNQGISAADASLPGNEEKDGYRNLSLSGRLGFKPSANLEVDFIARSLATKTDIDNFGGAYGDDPNNIQKYKSLFLKGEIRALLLDDRWEQKLAVAFVDSDRRNNNPEDVSHPFDSENGIFKGALIKLDWQNNLFLNPGNTLIFGVDYKQEQAESEYQYLVIWGASSSIFPLKKAYMAGLYFQDQIRIANRFFIAVGGRFDNHNRSGHALTFRLAPAYFIEKTRTRIKATLGTGFKSPSLYQLFAPGTFWGPIGNNNLWPEKSIGWDVGFDQELFRGRYIFGGTYFYNSYRDLIFFDFLRGYTNIGRAESKGWEFYLEAKPSDGLALKGTFVKLEAKDKESGNYLLRRPRNKLTFNINYLFLKSWNLNLSLSYTGRRADINYSLWPASQVVLNGYTLLDLTLSFNLSSHLELFCSYENLLNKKYEVIYGYGTACFTAQAGLKLSL